MARGITDGEDKKMVAPRGVAGHPVVRQRTAAGGRGGAVPTADDLCGLSFLAMRYAFINQPQGEQADDGANNPAGNALNAIVSAAHRR